MLTPPLPDSEPVPDIVKPLVPPTVSNPLVALMVPELLKVLLLVVTAPFPVMVPD